jgi:3-carboxy-cis,cis-muconate cycloisomerase
MAAHAIDSLFFQHLFATEEMRCIFADESLFQGWLDVEAALARAEARLGIIPHEAAREISQKALARHLDMAQLQRQIQVTGQIIVPLVRVLAAACEGDAGQYVHWGATTQDIMDTGVVLQLRQVHEIITRDLGAIRRILIDLARKHKHTPMPGRTYGQQALPITFGYKVAVWLAEVCRHIERLKECGPRLLVGQFAGATGTLASLGEKGLQVQVELMRELGLGVPDIAWHASRDRFAEFASLLSMICTTQAKIAKEIIALQKTEIAELEEPQRPGNVGSSTMPHKRNPMICEGIAAGAKLVRAAVQPAHEGMLHEHERDTWWAEWAYLPEACMITGAILERSRYALGNLVVRPEAMRTNLSLTGGLIASEAVMLELAKKTGRQTAHDWVHELAMESISEGVAFRECLLGDPKVTQHLSEAELDALLDPGGYMGLSARFVDRVIALAAGEG